MLARKAVSAVSPEGSCITKSRVVFVEVGPMYAQARTAPVVSLRRWTRPWVTAILRFLSANKPDRSFAAFEQAQVLEQRFQVVQVAPNLDSAADEGATDFLLPIDDRLEDR